MKEFRLQLLAMLFAGSLVSCSQDPKEFETASIESAGFTHQLEIVGEYSLPLDSITPGNLSLFQYFKGDSVEYFTLLNPVTQEINFYDLERQDLVFKVPLKYEGPHSVGNLRGYNSGYHIHNLDSIFVLSRNRGAFFLVNHKSERLLTYDFMRSKELPSAILPEDAPMVINGDMAILSNIPAKVNVHKRNKSYLSEYATLFNLQDMSMSFALPYPEVYSSGVWPITLYKVSWANDFDHKRLLVSFPLDDRVYVYDYDFNLINTINTRSTLKRSNVSITKKQASDKFEMKKYYWSQSNYNKMYYDPYRKIYLRECIGALSPKGLLQMDQGIIPSLDRAIIIMDENLNVIGELIEPFKEELNMFFAQDGIYRWFESETEDKLKFYKYELSNIKQSNALAAGDATGSVQ